MLKKMGWQQADWEKRAADNQRYTSKFLWALKPLMSLEF
jgi:hypothetical protein